MPQEVTPDGPPRSYTVGQLIDCLVRCDRAALVTAECWASDDAEQSEYPTAVVVDAVRIDGALHLVVVDR